MKNPKTTWHYLGDKTDFMELVGFSGYHVNRFNDIVSFQSVEGTILAPWPNRCGKNVVWRVNLFDDTGKRRQVSRRKVLVNTLGKDEFERREALRKNRVTILEKEEQEWKASAEERRRKDIEMVKEIHKDTVKRCEVPLHTLEPFVANLIRKKREKELGELL